MFGALIGAGAVAGAIKACAFLILGLTLFIGVPVMVQNCAGAKVQRDVAIQENEQSGVIYDFTIDQSGRIREAEIEAHNRLRDTDLGDIVRGDSEGGNHDHQDPAD